MNKGLHNVKKEFVFDDNGQFGGGYDDFLC